jgi:MFS family permease
MNHEEAQPKRIGRIRRGWLATKGSWTVLKMDKRLMLFSLAGYLISWVILIAGIAAGFMVMGGHFFDTDPAKHHGVTWQAYAIWIIAGALIYIITTLASAAIAACALKRFRGERPTLKYGLSAVSRRFGSLVFYALFSGVIAQIFGFLENRLPLFGRLITYLTNVIWSAATMLAVPVIVDSQKPVSPLSAVKSSTGMIKRIWGEAIGGQVSLGIIFGPILLIEILAIPGILLAATFASTGSSASGYSIAIPATIASILLFSTLILLNALGAILNAALYFYASAGKAPEQFSKEMLRQAFNRRKARKLFARA